MNEVYKKMKKKIDIEAKLFMYSLGLKEEPNKEYSKMSERNIVYIFSSKEEFKKYFSDNQIPNIDEDLLELCKMKRTKKGNIIALKGLCDYIISRKIKETESNSNIQLAKKKAK